jgi:hypothetical protein
MTIINIELVTGAVVAVNGENVHTNDLDWVATQLWSKAGVAGGALVRSSVAPRFETADGVTVFINPDHVVRVYEAKKSESVYERRS